MGTARTVAALIAATLSIAVMAAPAGAATPPNLHASVGSFSGASVDFALGGNYVYWVVAKEKRGRFVSASLERRDITTGATTKFTEPDGSYVTGLSAEPGQVAFQVDHIGTLNRRHPRSQDTTTLYTVPANTMPAGTVPVDTPVQIDSATADTRLVVRHARRANGRHSTYTLDTSCGDYLSLWDVSETGQVLAELSSTNCQTHKDIPGKAVIYPAGGGEPQLRPPLSDAFIAMLRFNQLISSSTRATVATDLATGAVRTFQDRGVIENIDSDAAGDFTTVTDVHSSSGRYHLKVNLAIYPAGSATPSATWTRTWPTSSTLVLCTGGVVEIHQPSRGATTLTWRSMTGQIGTSFQIPRSDFEYDAECTGSHLTMAVKAGSGEPQVLGYDF